jgi:hypothetical protein
MIFRREAMIVSAGLSALALAACEEAPPTTGPVARLPAQLCNQARDALEQVSGMGVFEYSKEGEATIEEAAWLPMGGNQRDALAQALAFHAACSAKEPSRERTIIIRNEGGRVLTQRVMETTIDISKLLEQ